MPSRFFIQTVRAGALNGFATVSAPASVGAYF